MTTMPNRETRSPKMLTTPDVKSSFSVTTTVVRRVMILPTGLRSKERRWSYWMWEKIAIRRSNMIFWPVQLVR